MSLYPYKKEPLLHVLLLPPLRNLNKNCAPHFEEKLCKVVFRKNCLCWNYFLVYVFMQGKTVLILQLCSTTVNFDCDIMRNKNIPSSRVFQLKLFFPWLRRRFHEIFVVFWWKYLATLLRAHGLSAQNQNKNKLSFANIAKFTFILEIVIFESSRKIWKSWKRNRSNPRFSWTSWIDVKEKWIWFEKESEDVRTVWSTKTTKSPNWKRVANANSWNTVRKSAK